MEPRGRQLRLSGFVTRFEVPADVVARYPRQIVGGRRHEELWVPAAELTDFCEAFIHPIAVTHGWLGARFGEIVGWNGPTGALSPDQLSRVIGLIDAGPLSGGPLTGR